MIYKILWIDDVPNEEFIIEAESYGLEIEQCICYNDGISWLKKNREMCSAVILDVNCKITKDSNEAPNVDAFTNSYLQLIQLCSDGGQIPWFVYTAGDYDGVSALNVVIPSNLPWLEGRKYFNKPAERKELLESIRKYVYVSDFRQIIEDYNDVFTAFPERQKRLLKLIYRGIVQNEYTEASLLNDVRKMLEWMVKYMRKHGLLPEHVKKLSNAKYYLAELSKKDPLLVPKYISWGFTVCEEITQNGSHESDIDDLDDYDEDDTEVGNLIVDAEVSNGKYPYMIKSVIYELLHLLSWMSYLPTDSNAIDLLSIKIETWNIQDYNK